ncbi:MAG: response regulator transcription factor [Betaproteobacteria bacterium]
MKKILIADDEPNIVAALDFLLRRHGYEVQVATTGQEALDLVAAGRPDLVLLDVMMPVVNGYDVCRAIRAGERGGALKIVMLTAKGEQAEKAAAAGADLYFPKPFSTSELVGVIGQLLAR